MIRHIAFDLDGVLMDSRDLHLDALNAAIEKFAPDHVIPRETNDGVLSEMPSRRKLEVLNSKGLDHRLNDMILQEKQRQTLRWIDVMVSPDKRLQNLISLLRAAGAKISIVTNAHRETAEKFVVRAGLEVDCIVGNEDVSRWKPNPDGYVRAMARVECGPEETLVFEDTTHGMRAGIAAGARVTFVDDPQYLPDLVMSAIVDAEQGYLRSDLPNVYGLKIVMPMAGEGRRFRDAGYAVPKPFIEVDGIPMYERVLESLGISARTFLLTRDWDGHQVDLGDKRVPAQVIKVPSLTEGAASTVLLAGEELDSDDALIIVNSDNIVGFDFARMHRECVRKDTAGCIVVFRDDHPKWSFAKLGPDGFVTEVAEKRPISDMATAGVYYWRRARDFARYARQMIAQDKRVNGEFYVCPVYNEAIADGKRITVQEARAFHSVGTPEDLDAYVSSRNSDDTRP